MNTTKRKPLKLIAALGISLAIALSTIALMFFTACVPNCNNNAPEHNFTNDRVLFSLTREATLLFLDYTPECFPEIDVAAVYMSSPRVAEWVRKQLLGIPTEETMLVNIETFTRGLTIVLAEPCYYNVLNAIYLLEQREDIAGASPNHIGSWSAVTANDARRSEQWGLDNIHINSAWAKSTGYSSVKV